MKIKNSKKAISNYFDASNRMRWGILTVTIVIFTLLLYPNLVITKHQYNLGDVAERDIKAPKNFFIEDKSATEKKRQQAMSDVLTVYDYDADLATTISQNVNQAFAGLRAVIEAERSIIDQDSATAFEVEEIIFENNKLSLHE
jgi:membrane-associated HD superfamily phosphohydrolase